MKRFFLLIALSTTLLFAELPKYEITPKFGGVVFDNSMHLDETTFFGLGIGRHLTGNWMLNFSYYKTHPDYEDGGSTDISMLTFNPEYYFGTGTYRPYLTAGLGYWETDNDRYSFDDQAFFNYGAGTRININDLSLGFEIKHATDFHQDGFESVWFSVALSIPFGSKAAPAAPKTINETPPPSRAIPLPGTSSLRTPNDDNDQDGVLNKADQCPNTPKGFTVDEKGCEKTYTFEVHFDFDHFNLTDTARASIENFVNFLKENPGYDAVIEGHTDSKGSVQYNIDLSKKRAQSVHDAIVAMGIDAKRLGTRGFGEAHPVATNETEEGRAKNRRAEARLIIR